MSRNIVYGACDWCMWTRDADALCALLAQEGIGTLQVLLTKSMLDAREGIADAETLSSLRDSIRRHGITVAAVMGSVLDDVSIAADGEERKVLLDYLWRTIDAADALGAPMVVAPLFGVSYPNSGAELKRAAENLAWACDCAGARGILIGMEDILPADELDRLLKMVNRSNLRLFFDSQNYFTFRGENAAGRYRQFADSVCGVHFKDCDSDGKTARLGAGVTGFPETAEAVASSEYAGCVILENDYTALAREAGAEAALAALRTDLKILRELFEK